MAFDFAKVKTSARRVVHETLGVRAFYQDSSLSEPEAIKARWHNKIDRMGDLDNQLYAEIIQGIDRVIFNVEDARSLNVKRGGVVTFPDYDSGLGDSSTLAFTLSVCEPSSGPLEEVWLVTRVEGGA